MRFVLRGLKDQNKWTQEEVGKRLGGLTQQAAQTILNKNGNFSRQTALKLAEICGFDSPESMLRDLGTAPKPPVAGQWTDRDIAAGVARRLGVDEQAIERVVGRYGEAQFMSRPAKWWVERFIQEDRELEEERRRIPKAAESGVPAAPKKAKRKKAS